MDRILDRARQGGYAVGYFESWDQYSLEAAIEAAEEAESPAILGFGAAVTSEAWMDRWGVEGLSKLCTSMADRASVPTAVLFNEARSFDHAVRGLYAGCNAVMLDTSDLSYEASVDVTRRLVEVAHALDATVEAELGHLADAGDASGSAGVPTDPAMAARFVDRTGVDALAVSVGNVHLLTDGESTIDLDLLERIHNAVALPPVLHGGSGLPPAAVRDAVERGVAKINYGTRSKQRFLEGVRAALAAMPERPNVHQFIGSREESDIAGRGKANVKTLISDLIKLYGSAGQAAHWET
jgi:ketose-bisphosphate aldolase